MYKLVLLNGAKYIKRVFYSFYIISPLNQKKFIDKNGYIISNKSKIVYYPLAKCGCSSIKTMFYTYENDTDIKSEHLIHNVVNENKIFYKNLPNTLTNYEHLAVVRNPFERFVSFYKNKFESFNTIRGDRSPEFAYTFYLNGILNSSMSFDEVVEVICNIPDRLSERHFQSQFYSLSSESAYNDMKILKLEESDVLKKYFDEKLNLDMVKLNKTQSENNSYYSYYSLTTLQKIYDRYSDDVNIFGYKNVYKNIKNSLEIT